MTAPHTLDAQPDAAAPEPVAQAENQPTQDTQGSQDPPTVPVDEARRYRKRARAAEEQLNDVTRQLRDAQAELSAARDAVGSLERREKIGDHLRQAGAVDLDVARLLTEMAVADMDEPDVRAAVDDLRKHKPYLFADRAAGLSRRSMGPRVDPPDPADNAAEQAGQTGDRRDLMTYLRLRRQA